MSMRGKKIKKLKNKEKQNEKGVEKKGNKW